MRAISFAVSFLLAGGSAFAGSSVIVYTPSHPAGHAATYINAHVVRVNPRAGTITFRSESRDVVLTAEGAALLGLGRLHAGDDVLLGYRVDRCDGRPVRIVNAILPGDGLSTGPATRGTVTTFPVLTPSRLVPSAPPTVVAEVAPVAVPNTVVLAPQGVSVADSSVNGNVLRNDTIGFANIGPVLTSPYNREIPSLPAAPVRTGTFVTPSALAPALTASMPVGASRELAARDYENSVRVLSAQANEIDGYWARYRDTCQGGASAGVPSTVRAMLPSTRDREWFAVLTNEVLPPTEDQCRQLLSEMTRVATDWKDAMVGAEQNARAYDVMPGSMRETRQRYRVDF
jgi:hypothetical protein